jgi:RNA polymerase sigma-70 factor (ECF subfamily)
MPIAAHQLNSNPEQPTGVILRPEMTRPSLVSDISNVPVAGDARIGLDSVGRAQAGDVDAFEAIYREHSGRMYALCLRLVGGDANDATELLQDVFVRAWRKLDTFRGECAFSSWLHRLAVNTMLENARSEGRRTARVLPMDDTSRLAGAARSSGVELRLDMEKAIASLPKGARLAFVLHDVEGYQHQEIATQLSVTVGTVKAQLHRARRLLRERLER